MHRQYGYASCFAARINEYISIRRNAGFQFDNPAYWLYRFDQYCINLNVQETSLTKPLYEGWGVKRDTETKTTQCNRLQALRGFSYYLNTLGIQSYLPQNLPKPEKTVPYLMTDNDIREFFEQVDAYETSSSVKAFVRLAQEYKILFRLIYCCGLRNNEACTLKISDINMSNGSFVLRRTKGNKERIVYMPEDLLGLSRQYLEWLAADLRGCKTEWLFPGKDPQEHIPKTSVDRKFDEFWNKTNACKNADKKPTVHCLRHAFVIKRINLWMEEGTSLQVMLPYLSSYLGHKRPMETYYYYHQVEDAFKTVRAKDKISSAVIPEVPYEE